MLRSLDCFVENFKVLQNFTLFSLSPAIPQSFHRCLAPFPQVFHTLLKVFHRRSTSDRLDRFTCGELDRTLQRLQKIECHVKLCNEKLPESLILSLIVFYS